MNLRDFVLLATALAAVLPSCSDKKTDAFEQGCLDVSFYAGSLVTRSSDPDEEKISDLNVFLFNSEGLLEESRYISRREISVGEDGQVAIRIKCLAGEDVSLYACANMGYRISGVTAEKDLLSLRYHLAYPDEYSAGIPMSGRWKGKVTAEDNKAEIELVRMMSKISVKVDRSALKENVRLNVRSVEIKQCPRSILLFGESKAQNAMDVFSNGFMKSLSEADGLNIESSRGISREVSCYMLENMQGNLLKGIGSEREKILRDNSPEASVASYLEIKAEYFSDSLHTLPEEYLIYRYYLGESPENFDIERNCSYTFTVKPHGDGLGEAGWRVDKSALTKESSKGSVKIIPSNYIEGSVGDSVHLRAEIIGDTVDFKIGEEELEYDKSRGIYDYALDSDGFGVTLLLVGKGSGIIYMENGDDADMAVIVVK